MDNQELEAHNALVFSYLTLRKAIGILGIALPFILALGALIVFQTGLQGSISGYYYTGMRDVFVGSLWATAFFLLAYKGYGLADNILSDIGCIAAVGITLFPTAPAPAHGEVLSAAVRWISAIHFAFGLVFFLALIIFSLFLFTKTAANLPPTPEKLQRNRVYRVCGYTMAACMVLIGIYGLLKDGPLAGLAGIEPEFWLETIALLAFGVSWLTKGQAILQDPGVPGAPGV